MEEDTNLSRRVGEEKEAVGMSLGSLPRGELVQMVEVGETSSILIWGQGGYIRPTTGRKAPTKKFKGWLKRPQRYWLGTVALSEIQKYQKSTKLFIFKCPSLHLVHEIAQGQGAYDIQFQVQTIIALQEAMEHYLVNLFEDANMCAIHARFITIMAKDIQLVCWICVEQPF